MAFPQTNATATRVRTMGQSYPLIRPGPGANPSLYPSFLGLDRRGLPEDRISKGHLFFSFFSKGLFFSKTFFLFFFIFFDTFPASNLWTDLGLSP